MNTERKPLAESKSEIENILILDTETGGLDSRLHSLLEIGVIQYNVPTQSVLFKGAGLLYAEFNPVAHINNIDIESCKKINPVLQETFLGLINLLLADSDIVIAHNAPFDRKFIEANEFLRERSLHIKWLCTKSNFYWNSSGLKLRDIARDYGVDYEGAHRALADCEILLQCLQKLPDFHEQLYNAYQRVL